MEVYGPVARIHALGRVRQRLNASRVLVESEHNQCSGAQRAVDEYFAAQSGIHFERRRPSHVVTDDPVLVDGQVAE